eukprot:482716-Amphidinium_carterae.1
MHAKNIPTMCGYVLLNLESDNFQRLSWGLLVFFKCSVGSLSVAYSPTRNYYGNNSKNDNNCNCNT